MTVRYVLSDVLAILVFFSVRNFLVSFFMVKFCRVLLNFFRLREEGNCFV